MNEKPFSQIEQLEEYTVQVNAAIERLKNVGSKEEFYPLEESAKTLLDAVETLETPEKDGLIDALTSAVIEADERVSEGRTEIEGEMEEELEEAA